MSRVAQTLWDLLTPPRKSRAKPEFKKRIKPAPALNRSAKATGGDGSGVNGNGSRPTMQQRYDALVLEMKRAYGFRVRKWRNSSTGCAWEVHYADGTISRLLESPYPRGPMSCAIFLHEVGHHAIGLRRYKPRCLEEYHAWRWAIETMRRKKFNVTANVEKRMAESLKYALAKARRRGLKRIPSELAPFA